jgi:CBS domain-containing protein/nitroimidazol reductase NimA-like FMN-containing flavoprotein (pyridoxamine 5'-phosphate oxidase superfamily)
MRVRDWMSPDPVTVRSDESVIEARRMITERGVRHLPVVDREGRLVGMLSDRDVLAGATDRGRRPHADDDVVAGIMSHPVHSVDPSSTMADAARLMLSRRINAVPVVDGDELTGLVTSSDCMLALLERVGGERPPEAGDVLDTAEADAQRTGVADADFRELDVDEAMIYLSRSRLGRLAFNRGGRPELLPLNCRWHAGAVIVRLGYGRLLESIQDQQVVFEVDGVDAEAPWSVVVHGEAKEVYDPDEIAQLDALALRPWAPGTRDHYVQIRPTRIIGRIIEPQ